MTKNLIERLNKGPVICAEGFLFEIEKRGYMASGEFVPMVSLDHPEALESLHKDFQHAGSDVVQAFTYNGHREKMKIINKEDLLEPLNRAALKIAKKVANLKSTGECPNLMAGNISNSNIWNDKDKKTHLEVEKMFIEMVRWAVDEGADMLIGETFYYAEEAYTALKVMKKTGLPSVITIAPMGENIMRDGVSILDTCKELEQRGGEVVGMNCFRGPSTMMPYLKEIRKALKCHVAALPITYILTPRIIAMTGWKTYDLINEIESSNFEKKYDYVSLLIGVNNQFNSRSINEFEDDLDKLLTKINNLKKKDGSVLIISIPDWGSSPFGENMDRNQISTEINSFNNSLKSFANINGLKYVDVTEISRRAINEPNLITSDNLHPSGLMYLEWAKKIFNVWIN